ncbi:MAG: DUF4440 domain-containing protein [Brucellaceae bacterium]|nr:DUF4440 domain-containing protein [Brucellaceae bacterium]
MRGLRLAATALLLLGAALPAAADPAEILDRWYAALMQPDRAALAAMLDEDATITLEDLDIGQTRDEFIESMDEWEDAVKDASERHRLDSTVGDTVTMLVCYSFPGNELLMRESFTFAGEMIAQSTQATVAEDCSTF